MNVYGDIIHEHSRNPRGDRVRIELSLASDDTIDVARFQGDLCLIAKAASSLLTEMIAAIPVARAANFPEHRLLDALQAEIQPARRRCALLPLEVLHSGVSAWLRR